MNEKNLQLIQIGEQKAPEPVTIQQMFERLAQREVEMIQEARQRAIKRIKTNA